MPVLLKEQKNCVALNIILLFFQLYDRADCVALNVFHGKTAMHMLESKAFTAYSIRPWNHLVDTKVQQKCIQSFYEQNNVNNTILRGGGGMDTAQVTGFMMILA